MSQSLSKILVHTVFSTKHRQPFLRDTTVRADLHTYLGGIVNKMKCQSILAGGVEDHVHILSALGRTCVPANLVKELKRGSTLWLKKKGPQWRDFEWQEGYGMFSIGFSQIDAVKKYISNQEEHHRKTSFQDEFRKFLRKYEVEYDEHYVWD